MRRDRVQQLLLADAVLRRDGDRVEAGLAEHAAGRLDVEERDRGAAEAVDVAELDDPGQLVAAHRALTGDLDRVADVEVLLVGGARVDHDLARAGGPVAVDELERVEALVGRVDAEAEGRVVALDRLALPVEDLRLVRVAGEVEDRAGGGLDLGQRPHLGEHVRRRSAPCRSATTRRASCPRRRRRSARTSSRRSSRTPCRSCR